MTAHSSTRARLIRRSPLIARRFVLALALASIACTNYDQEAPVVRINGSTTLNPVVTEIANILKVEQGMTITVDTQGGSSGGVSGAADGSADIGMSSKPLTASDRDRHPKADLRAVSIGSDAVAIAVHETVWNGGARSLTRDELRAIYERRIVNWRDVGGPDLPIVFFDKEPGRGTWEVFAHWIYPSSHPPTISHPQVGGNEEGRTKTATTPGAVTQLSASWVTDSPGIHALGLDDGTGTVVAPTPEAISRQEYPMLRPLLLVTDGPPDPLERVVVDFALSKRGQDIVAKHGYLPVRSGEASMGASE